MGQQKTSQYAEHAAMGLLDLRNKRRRFAAIRLRDTYRPIAIIENGSVKLATCTLDELIETLFEARVVFQTIHGATHANWLLPPRPVESLDRFCWLFGERFARERGLLPWLSESRSHRLLAWPDFGEKGIDPQGVAYCNLLAREPLSPQQTARRLDLHPALVFGSFNAAALCGVLVVDGNARSGNHRGRLTAARKRGVPNRKSLFSIRWRLLKE